MARNSCSALRPIARYLVTWNAGGYQVSQSSFQGQSDPYRNQVLTWLSQLAEQDYQQDLPHAGPPPKTAPGSSQLAEQHHQQNGRCLARADGVLLDIRRRLEQEKTNEAGRIYSFHVTLYKWPKLGWVWLTCLGLAILAILALAVSAIAVELRLTRLAKESDDWRNKYQQLQGQYNKLVSDSTTLHESYRKAQVISDFTKKLRNIAENAERAKADDRAQVTMQLLYQVKGGSGELVSIPKPAEEWKKLCDFLDKCEKFFADKPQEPAKEGEGQ
jgi:hypothetical protein